MAQATTITNLVRDKMTRFLRNSSEIDEMVNLVEAMGATDTARRLFFAEYLDTAGTDISTDEFIAALTAMRDLQGWMDTNRGALAKLIR